MTEVSDVIVNARFCFTIFLCIVGLIAQKNRFVFLIQGIWWIILACFNTFSVDWNSNYGIYLNSGQTTGLYSTIINFAKNRLNANFETFNGILAFISIVIIAFIIYKNTNRPSLVMSLYLIFPLYDNIVQKRYFYAMGLIALAVWYLLKEHNLNVKLILIYELIIFLANRIHNSFFIFYFLPFFLLLPLITQKYLVVSTVVIGIIFNGKLLVVVNWLMGTGVEAKTSMYLSSGKASIKNLIIWFVWQSIQCYLVYVLSEETDNYFARRIFQINLFSMMLIPFYMFDPMFTRCFKPIMLYNYILISNLMEVNYQNGVLHFDAKKVKILSGYLLLTIITFIIFDVSTQTSLGFNQIVKTIYANNSLLK